MINNFGFTDVEAAKNIGIKDRRAIGYARRIMGSKFNEEYNILDSLKSGKRANIKGKFTGSIEVAKKEVVKLEEAEMMGNPEDMFSDVEVNYNDMVLTEHAEEHFWRIFNLEGVNKNIEIIRVLNAFYKEKESSSKELDKDHKDNK